MQNGCRVDSAIAFICWGSLPSRGTFGCGPLNLLLFYSSTGRPTKTAVAIKLET